MAGITQATAEQCCAHCASTTGCAVGVFVHNPPCANGTAPQDCGQCYMKSSASQPYGKPGAISCHPKSSPPPLLLAPPRLAAASWRAQDYPRVAVALGNASDPLLQRWTKTSANPIQWEDPSQPASFPGRVWRVNTSLQGGGGHAGTPNPFLLRARLSPSLPVLAQACPGSAARSDMVF